MLHRRVLSGGRGKAPREVRASATLRAKDAVLPAAGSALSEPLSSLCKMGTRLSITQVVVEIK